MQKLGLKLWSTNSYYVAPARELYGKKVCDYVELFVEPGSAENYLRLWEGEKFDYMLHAPHYYAGFNFSAGACEPRNREFLREVDLFRGALHPRHVIFHSGLDGTVDEAVRQIGLFKREFPEIFDIAVIENKPRRGIKGERCVGSSPEEIRRLTGETGLGFCLDIGHAICYGASGGIGYKEIIEKFMRFEPAVIHLSDGDAGSKTDMHLNLGKGNFDLKEIIRIIPENAFVSIETDKGSVSDLADFERDAAYYRGCYRALSINL